MIDYSQIPDCFYRLSIKALILNEEGRFLLCRENIGQWELPGGGLEFGESPRDGIVREMKEEMWLEVTSVAEKPSYFLTCFQNEMWRGNVLYETQVKNLDFIASEECEEIWFFTPEEALRLPLFYTAIEFCKQYKL